MEEGIVMLSSLVSPKDLLSILEHFDVGENEICLSDAYSNICAGKLVTPSGIKIESIIDERKT